MLVSEAFSLLRRLSTPAIVRRGVVVLTLVLAERLLLAAEAWAFFGSSLRQKVSLAVVLGAVFSGRTFAQYAFRTRTEADLLERVVSSLVEGDVLRVNALPDEDARAELGQAVYLAAQSVSLEVPRLAADVLGAALLGGFILAREPAKLAGLALGVTLVAAVALLVMRRSMEKAYGAAWTAHQRVFAGFVDALEGRLDVVASGRRAPFLAKMRVLAQAWATSGTQVAVEALVSNKLPLLAIAMAVFAAVALVGRQMRWPAIADVALLASMTPAFSGVAQGMLAFARAEQWMRLVASALAERRTSAPGRPGPPPLPARIAFEGVTFSYQGMAEEALHDVSFACERGGVLALSGANGSGKSTCLRLLLALARPHAGAVTVGGVRLDEIDPDAWRTAVAFLPQRPYLPARADVRAAVHFLAPDTPDATLREALDRVGLLAALSNAGDPLAARVDGLSVGERQRVALARLLCQKASLIVLDEPDANLDRGGIVLVAGLVRELARGRMVALAAHTPELLEVADRVVVLERGRVLRNDASARLATTI